METLEEKIAELRASIDLLILIEFCKRGAKRDDVRDVLGTPDNNLFARVNRIVNQKQKT